MIEIYALKSIHILIFISIVLNVDNMMRQLKCTMPFLEMIMEGILCQTFVFRP